MNCARSIPAGAVEDPHRLGLPLADVGDAQRVRLEAAEPLHGRIGLEADGRGVFVVAVGEVALGALGGQIFEELDRVLAVGRGLDHAGARDVDVGAGAGLPGIPLAICLPELQVTAIDAVQKKVSFMRQAKAELGLRNFNAIHGRIEDQKVPSREMPEKFEVITSRAFSEIGLFVKLTKHLLAEGGKWLAMKGVIPQHEFEKSGIQPAEIKVLKVAGLDAERHLIVLK